MSDNLLKWSLWCETCDCERTGDYVPESDGTPTVCPYNHDHTNVRDQVVADTKYMEVGQTRIIDVAVLDPETARTIYDGYEIDVQQNDQVAEWKEEVPFPMEFVCGETFVKSDDVEWDYNDKVDFFLCPPSPAPGTLPIGMIGQAAADAAQGQPVVQVDASVLANIKPGFFLCFGANEKDTKPYKIKSIDAQASTVTLMEDLAADVALGTPVVLRVYYLRNWAIYKSVIQKFASDTPGAAYVDAGFWTFIHLKLENPAGSNYKWNFGLTKKY